MAKFIHLTQRYGDGIYVNVETIVAFHGNHHLGEGWQFTHIIHTYGWIEVKEDEETILNLIRQTDSTIVDIAHKSKHFV